MTGARMVDQSEGVSLRVSAARGRVDVRRCSRLSSSSGVWAPDARGVTVTVETVPALCAALVEAAKAAGGGE